MLLQRKPPECTLISADTADTPEFNGVVMGRKADKRKKREAREAAKAETTSFEKRILHEAKRFGLYVLPEGEKDTPDRLWRVYSLKTGREVGRYYPASRIAYRGGREPDPDVGPFQLLRMLSAPGD